jgi:hypothetical protein
MYPVKEFLGFRQAALDEFLVLCGVGVCVVL